MEVDETRESGGVVGTTGAELPRGRTSPCARDCPVSGRLALPRDGCLFNACGLATQGGKRRA